MSDPSLKLVTPWKVQQKSMFITGNPSMLRNSSLFIDGIPCITWSNRWIACYKYAFVIDGLPVTGIPGISRTEKGVHKYYQKLMFRQHWQTMLNKCCLNGPVPTGIVDLHQIAISGDVWKATKLTNWKLMSEKAGNSLDRKLSDQTIVTHTFKWVQLHGPIRAGNHRHLRQEDST